MTSVAQLRIDGEDLLVRLNWLEKCLALRRNVHVPIFKIRSATVLNEPLKSQLYRDIFGRTAPRARLGCVAPWATWQGGQALVIIYGNKPSVVVELGPNDAKWRLIVLSTKHAGDVATRVNDAARYDGQGSQRDTT